MEAIILSKEQFEELLTRVNEIKSALAEKNKKPEEQFLDNQEFMQLMNISKRTAQTWRDEGKISFSQIGGKIYYRLDDVQNLLDSHHIKAYKGRCRKKTHDIAR